MISVLTPLPVLLPLLGAAAALLVGGRHPGVQRTLSILVLTAVLTVSVVLLVIADSDGAAAVSEASVPVEPDGDAEPASEGAEAEGAGADEEEVSEAAPWASPSCGAAQPASTRARATEVPHTRRARNGAG